MGSPPITGGTPVRAGAAFAMIPANRMGKTIRMRKLQRSLWRKTTGPSRKQFAIQHLMQGHVLLSIPELRRDKSVAEATPKPSRLTVFAFDASLCAR
jgi:hypothetical protein